MFTGIIEAVGEIRNLTPCRGDLRVVVDCGDLEMGAV
ncbi:MAG: riboflavin synthase, partial [Gammaproteobacteria bacterium]|nr:riboflavin synthase [Gammaproteobacteria bacterium]MCF6338765.1 riboflavin synthase [Gammaproteobacteria bacterium]